MAVELSNYARQKIKEVYPDKHIATYRFVEDVPDESVDLYVFQVCRQFGLDLLLGT